MTELSPVQMTFDKIVNFTKKIIYEGDFGSYEEDTFVKEILFFLSNNGKEGIDCVTKFCTDNRSNILMSTMLTQLLGKLSTSFLSKERFEALKLIFDSAWYKVKSEAVKAIINLDLKDGDTFLKEQREKELDDRIYNEISRFLSLPTR